jgi:hypothetical protein
MSSADRRPLKEAAGEEVTGSPLQSKDGDISRKGRRIIRTNGQFRAVV